MRSSIPTLTNARIAPMAKGPLLRPISSYKPLAIGSLAANQTVRVATECPTCREISDAFLTQTKSLIKAKRGTAMYNRQTSTIQSQLDVPPNLRQHLKDRRCSVCAKPMEQLKMETIAKLLPPVSNINNNLTNNNSTNGNWIPNSQLQSSIRKPSKLLTKPRSNPPSTPTVAANTHQPLMDRSGVVHNNNNLVTQAHQYLEDFVLAWKPRGDKANSNKKPNGQQQQQSVVVRKKVPGGHNTQTTSVYDCLEPQRSFLPAPIQISSNFAQRNSGGPNGFSMSHSMDPSRLQSALLQQQRPNDMLYLRSTTKISSQPSCSSSPPSVAKRPHSGRKSAKSGSHSSSPRHSECSSRPEPIRSFPTNFSVAIRERPPPAPPLLLRGPPAQPSRGKDFSGKVKVTLRVSRGLESSTQPGCSPPETSFITLDSRKRQISVRDVAARKLPGKPASVPKIFGFDSVFSPEDTQSELCASALTEVIQTVATGSDGCLFCFGHANLGKTFTMVGADGGNSQSLGIIPCAISWLYRMISEMRSKSGARFSLRVSALEVSGPQEQLRDLLQEYASGMEQEGITSAVCLREDPICGVQLQNLCELRAPTADKAAYYLDAALAGRNVATDEERRNSHLLFTIHLYQYKTDPSGSGGVAGGRSRLHLIDLGSGEKSTKPGRTSLTLPALGHVILTLLQGQKHLPYKDSKLSQLLKEAMGTAACKAVSVIACVSPEPERYLDTLNTIQMAARLYKIRRKRGKFGMSSGNSSGGESSCDDRSGRRRFPRSASDPDCTTSSSEQSCDTVIYLGDRGMAHSDTDGEHPPKFLPIIPRGKTTDKENAKPNDNNLSCIPEGTTTPRGTPTKLPSQLSFESNNLPTPTAATVASPRHFAPPKTVESLMIPTTTTSKVTEERWIDGPNTLDEQQQQSKGQKRPAELWVDGPSLLMDPGKRKMVAQWVTLQKQEMAAQQFAVNYQLQNSREIWIDQGPKYEDFPPHYYHPISFSPPTEPGGPRELHIVDLKVPNGQESMETSSEAVETVDVSVQIEESEIDLETGGSEQIWTQPIEPDVRILEDIAEVEEENCSSEGRSLRNGATNTDSLEMRNEGLSTFVDSDTLSRSGGLKIYRRNANTLQPDDHPLRILSREHMESARSDSVSFTTENLDNLSLPDTAEMNDEELLMTEEDLEKAMRASMTSIRSHEVLERLRTDTAWRAESPPLPNQLELGAKRPYDLNGNANGQKKKLPTVVIPQLKVTDTHCSRLAASESDSDSPHPSLMRKSSDNESSQVYPQSFERWCPEGASSSDVEKDSEAYCKGQQQQQSQLNCNPSRIALKKRSCCQAAQVATKQLSVSMRESDRIVLGHSGDLSDSSKSEKLHIPTIPTLSRSVAKEVVQKLTDGNKSALKSPNKSIPTPKGLAPMKIKSPTAPTVAAMTCSVVVEKTKIPSVEPQSKSSNSASFFGFKSPNTAKTSAKVTKSVPLPSRTVDKVELSKSVVKSTSKPAGKSSMSTSSETELKKESKSSGKSVRSPLMSFLRSPTKSSKLLPGPKDQSGGNRVSSGYDSGHDSGIVATISSCDKPAELISPYQKVTKPRTSQRSSSGHGSDNSSVVSSDFTTPNPPSKTKLNLNFTPNRPKNRHSVAASSGYESAGGNRECENPPTSPETGSDSSGHTEVKSCKISRISLAVPSVKASISAPQSPTKRTVLTTPKNDPKPKRDEKVVKQCQKQVVQIKLRQETLKTELFDAKERLGIHPSKWSYELHVDSVMDLSNPSIVEALQQETKILEKRVSACKAHVMMLTVFDSTPCRM